MRDPGTGRDIYEAAGAWVAGLCLVLAGPGPKWADAFQKIGDKLDTEVKADLKVIAGAPTEPPSA